MEIALKRYAVCKSCEFLNQNTSICKQCSCFMRIKCLMPNVKCPLGKWGEFENVEKYAMNEEGKY